MPDRPVGPLPLSVQTGDNCDLIWSVRELYLAGSALDITYGRGKWWTRYRPEPFGCHDIELDGVDFCALPEGAGSYDTVCFDPPYIPSGGPPTTAGAARLRSGFGITPGRSNRTLDGLWSGGFAEACRVARSWVLVKCMEYASSEFVDVPARFKAWAPEHGYRLHDQIVHLAGTGPGGHNIWEAKRTRRAHSYLLVFRAAR